MIIINLVSILLSILQISISFQLTSYQFMFNEYNHIYSLNTSLQLSSFLVQLFMILHTIINGAYFFTDYEFFIAMSIYLYFIIITDISLLSSKHLYSRRVELISKLILFITLLFTILLSFKVFSYIEVSIFIVYLFINILFFSKLSSSKALILKILKSIFEIVILILLLFIYNFQFQCIINSIIIFIYSVIVLLFIYLQIFKNSLIL